MPPPQGSDIADVAATSLCAVGGVCAVPGSRLSGGGARGRSTLRIRSVTPPEGGRDGVSSTRSARQRFRVPEHLAGEPERIHQGDHQTPRHLVQVHDGSDRPAAEERGEALVTDLVG
jgi:hypothetical protein